jgi:superfamily II DNA or RNA helicase
MVDKLVECFYIMNMTKTLQPTELEFIVKLTNMIRANIGKLDFEFRIHQVNALVAAIENDCGLFDMTCGLGKTLIQACIIYWNLLEKTKEGKPFKCLWVCHRLMLEKQVKSVFEAYFGEDFARLNCKIVVLNSEGDSAFKKVANDGMDEGDGSSVIYLTTTASINEYVKLHSGTRQDGKLFFAQNVLKELDLYIHDESHKEFCEAMVKTVLNAMTGKKAYFFTATPGQYLTKNLQTICKCTYAEAVSAGYIVKPKLYPVKCVDIANLNNNAFGNIVIKTAKHLKRSRKGEVPTLCVFMPSVDAVYYTGNILKEYKAKHRNFAKFNVYEIISEKELEQDDLTVKVGLRLNGSMYNSSYRKYKKEEILNILKEDPEPKIILNAFMLTEGIDLPNINGVLIACEKSDASLYQAVCRGCRTAPGKDSFNLYAITEDDIAGRTEKFIEELTNITGGCFDFGGTVEDENDGSNSDDNEHLDATAVPVTFSELYKKIEVIIKEKKTTWSKWQVVKNQLDELKAEELRPGKLNYIQMVVRLTKEWSMDPEFKECLEFVKTDHVTQVLMNK